MKRYFLVLFMALLLAANGFAQTGGFTQRGRAIREMMADGLRAAHSSIPLGSTVKVINAATGRSADVTITGRIPESPNRIIDLSPAVWRELDLNPDNDVILVMHFPVTTAFPEFSGSQPIGIVIHNYIIRGRGGQTVRHDQRGEEGLRGQPLPGVHILPRLPDPNSRGIYRLQVGAFSSREIAARAAQQLRVSGFEVSQEAHGQLLRVSVPGIRARDVSPVAQRLGALGFTEIWIRE